MHNNKIYLADRKINLGPLEVTTESLESCGESPGLYFIELQCGGGNYGIDGN